MRWALSTLLVGCTVITSPGDYEGGDGDGGVVSCMSDGDCPAGVCDTTRAQCVECLTDVDCPDTEDCTGGLCEPATCGGVVCPAATPVCLANEVEEECVKCVEQSDCPSGESCTAEFTCTACVPATECAADEACVVDDAGDFCLDCDGDDDGLIRRELRCEGVAGERDCDDDDDDFCVAATECAGECSEVAYDCDDNDGNVRPVLLACADSVLTSCADPGDLLPGADVASVTVMALGSLAEPLNPDIRTPMSVVAEAGFGTFDVVHLEGTRGSIYTDRFREIVDGEARSTAAAPLPATGILEFLDVRAKRDPAGTVYASLGFDSEARKTVEAVLVDSFEGAMLGSPVIYREADAVPPIDVSVEESAGASPYVVWMADKGDSYAIRLGFSGTLHSELSVLSPTGAPTLHTARGFVSAGVRAEPDLYMWDPEGGFAGTESRDAGGASSLVAGFSTIGFDARFTGGELAVRAITFIADGIVSNDPAPFEDADAASEVALAAYDNTGYIVFDRPTAGGERRLFASRASSAAGGTAVTDPFELTGVTMPDFSLIYSIEAAAQTTSAGNELAVLVHGTPVGAAEPGLYLIIARRCTS